MTAFTRLAPVPLLLACGPPDKPTPTPSDLSPVPPGVGDIDPTCYGRSPALVVGDGALGFTPLTPGQAVTMVHGPQGGWHVLSSALVANLRSVVEIDVSVVLDPSGDVVASDTYYVALLMTGTCVGEYPGIYAYLDVAALADGDLNTPPELLGGANAELRMRVEDSDTHTAEAVVPVILELDPIDVTPTPTGG